MKVKVKCFLFIREMLGFSEKVFELGNGSKVKDLLEILIEKYCLGDAFLFKGYTFTLIERGHPKDLIILIDGKNIYRMDGLSTELEDESVIALFPPVAGG